MTWDMPAHAIITSYSLTPLHQQQKLAMITQMNLVHPIQNCNDQKADDNDQFITKWLELNQLLDRMMRSLARI